MRSQVKETEIKSIREVMKSYEKDQKMSLVYVCVSKMTNAKFFHSKTSNSFKDVGNPNQGTYMYKKVCNNESDEFYLISQQTQQGISTPTNYFILENDLPKNENTTPEKVKDDLAKLIFKLSFLYYNTIGGIKVPAPIHYANRLSSHVGENSHR